MQRPISHLSYVPKNAKLMCWHPRADLAAYRVGEAEYLLADKRIYKFSPSQGSPAQLVATLRTLKPKEFTRCMKLLPTTFKPEEVAPSEPEFADSEGSL